MATHSSVLAWRIPEPGEPGGLSSMGSHRVGHDKRLSSSRSSRETDIENRLMDMGRGEERVRCMERVAWKLTYHM